MKKPSSCFLALLLTTSVIQADGPGDNLPDKVRRIPPPGIKLSASDREELASGIKILGEEIVALRPTLKGKPALLDLLPDVQVYHNAVRYALEHDEFFKPAEVGAAKQLLEQGRERARLLREGRAPWLSETGLVVRGYVSKIDDSVQPYGLVVPASYRPGSAYKHRLDLWFHGRGETLSEVAFIVDRQRSPGRFTPRDTFVLHPYGRYSNANHFAGEVDTFEAIEHAKKYYPIDPDRVTVRGFSMGGAACWHFAVHHAGMWAAAAPGAGFSETPEFLRTFQNETLNPTPYEKKLWHLYDCTDYAINLFNCPVVAYSGEKDRQKQAADIMARAMAEEGLTLTHIIGPNTAHTYHPDSRVEIDRRMDSILSRPRNPVPREVRFTTWTLRYNRMLWVQVDALEEHWERARVNATLTGPTSVKVTTSNVNALTLSMPPGTCPLDPTRIPAVNIDGKQIEAARVMSDRSWDAHFVKTADGWKSAAAIDEETLRKRHGLQGPIDDAFMDRFLMVRPTGKPANDTVGRWVTGELAHALEHWRRQFRGEALVKDDTSVTDADIAMSNLILWGDPSSNKVLARIADKLPIHWSAESIHVGARSYPSGQHVPVMIFPNPLNPKRYVVLNSGFTYREYDYLNNARQVPKLPDYAIVDVSVPPSTRHPGKIVTAGFFDEKWALPEQP